MRKYLIIPLELLGLSFVGIAVLNKLLNSASYYGDTFLIEGILIEILAFIIYYGEIILEKSKC